MRFRDPATGRDLHSYDEEAEGRQAEAEGRRAEAEGRRAEAEGRRAEGGGPAGRRSSRRRRRGSRHRRRSSRHRRRSAATPACRPIAEPPVVGPPTGFRLSAAVDGAVAEVDRHLSDRTAARGHRTTAGPRAAPAHTRPAPAASGCRSNQSFSDVSRAAARCVAASAIPPRAKPAPSSATTRRPRRAAGDGDEGHHPDHGQRRLQAARGAAAARRRPRHRRGAAPPPPMREPSRPMSLARTMTAGSPLDGAPSGVPPRRRGRRRRPSAPMGATGWRGTCIASRTTVPWGGARSLW